MSASFCRRCLEHPPLPRQRWCRVCFRDYRREQRQRARGQEGVTGDRAPEVAQGVSKGPEESVTVIPSLRVRIHPFGFLLRFRGGRIDPEDVPILLKLRQGAAYQAFAWIPREGH